MADRVQLMRGHNKILGQASIQAGAASDNDIALLIRLAMLLGTARAEAATTARFQMVNDDCSTDVEVEDTFAELLCDSCVLMS